MAVYGHTFDRSDLSVDRLKDRVRKLEQFAYDDKARIAELKVRMKDLEALFSEMAETQNEMVACQPDDPKGDLARAEARFDEHKKSVNDEPQLGMESQERKRKRGDDEDDGIAPSE